MRKIVLFIGISLLFFTSCHIGEDGRAYLSFTYADSIPEYVDVYYHEAYEDEDDNTYYEDVYIPNKWTENWGEYFVMDAGDYTVCYGVEVERSGKTIHEKYECDFEIWRNYGRTHERDGKDVYFDIILQNDGNMKFTYEEVRQKSCSVDERTLVYSDEYTRGDYTIRYSCYKVGESEE